MELLREKTVNNNIMILVPVCHGIASLCPADPQLVMSLCEHHEPIATQVSLVTYQRLGCISYSYLVN